MSNKKTLRSLTKNGAFLYVQNNGGRLEKTRNAFNVYDKDDIKIGKGTAKIDVDFKVSFVKRP